MPSRIGDTHYEWPDEKGIEPYLRADEIFFGGRDLTFMFLVKATNRETAQSKCFALYDDIDAFTGPVPFSSDLYGTYQVLVNNEIQIKYLGSGYCKGTLVMREPVVNLTGAAFTTDTVTPSIDGISLKKMGFVIRSTEGQYNRPAAKKANVTAYGFEGSKVTKSGMRTFNLNLAGSFTTYAAFNSSVRSLAALLALPNSRTLIYNGVEREFFAKDGFKVSKLYKQGTRYVCAIDLKLTEIRTLNTWNVLTDNSGNTLIDGNGVPIAELLKFN
jgi:hypothetical protein